MPIFSRDHNYINRLIGKRLVPNTRRKPIPYELKEQRIERLLFLKVALEANELTFDIFCREHPLFSIYSKRGRQRLNNMEHCRTFRDVRTHCLEKIHEELQVLMKL